MPDLPLIVVTGLRAEARLAARPGIRTVVGGGDAHRLAAAIERAIAEGCRGLMSFGVAGGLDPRLAAGTILIADAVVDAEVRYETDRAWSQRLATALPQASAGTMAGVDAAVMDVSAKQALHVASGASAVDMESHVVARAARRTGLPFAVIRAIADPAHRAVPPAAMAGMRADGRTDVTAVLRALVRRPWDLPALLLLARDAGVAMAALRRAAGRIAPDA